jgi:hypothetical protein
VSFVNASFFAAINKNKNYKEGMEGVYLVLCLVFRGKAFNCNPGEGDNQPPYKMLLHINELPLTPKKILT